MENKQRREKTIYDDSLLKIFFRSGVQLFVILLVVCTGLAVFFIYCGYSVSETIKLTIFLINGSLLLSYGFPLISLFKVWRQEHILGIYWKNRMDYECPEWEREWYLTYDRAGFILIHRKYIKSILGSKVEIEDTGSYSKGKAYCTVFEDITGKNHSLKFSSKSGEQEFQKWYRKQPYRD